MAAKSSERREIFEEACGIAKYRYRKTEAERRLVAAGENLERLRDILGELESRVGPLEKESAKAQKFLELSAQRKTMEVTLWTDGVHRAREAVRQQVRDYETAQTDYERFDRETKAAEQEAEEIRMQAQQLTVAVERLNGDIRSITQQISGSESRIAVLENDILRNDESAASLQQEIAAGQQDTAEADAALQRHRAVAKTMEAAGEKLAAEIEALNAELARLADASTASGARKDSLRAELADHTAKRTEAQVAQAAAEAAGDDDVRLAEYQAALALYAGDPLPRMTDEIWTIPIVAYYHSLYTRAAAGAIELLEKQERTAEAVALCHQAIHIEPYQEDLYEHLMRGLLRTGDMKGTMSVYEEMSELLFAHFGVMPSETLRTLYRQATRTVNDRTLTMDEVCSQLAEPAPHGGAMVCEYDFFKILYRAEARSIARNGHSANICLLSVSGKDGE